MYEELANHVALLLHDAPGGAIELAALGVALRRWQPGFHVRAYGHKKLLDLIRSLDVCTLEVDESGLHWTVVGAPATLVDATEDAGTLGTNGNAADSPDIPATTTQAPKVRVLAAWWDAIVRDDDTGAAWYDLASDSPSDDAEAFANEPERFVALPRWDARREATLLPQANPGDDREGAPLLTPAQRRKVGPALRKAVVRELLAWSQLHGVPPQAWQEPVSERPVAVRSRRAAPNPAPTGATADTRARLHAWIDACSDAEIVAIETVRHSLER